jgi:hypothetical protein
MKPGPAEPVVADFDMGSCGRDGDFDIADSMLKKPKATVP